MTCPILGADWEWRFAVSCRQMWSKAEMAAVPGAAHVLERRQAAALLARVLSSGRRGGLVCPAGKPGRLRSWNRRYPRLGMRCVAPAGAAHVARGRCRAVGNDLPGFVGDEEVGAGEDRLGEPADLQRQRAQDGSCRGVEQIDGG